MCEISNGKVTLEDLIIVKGDYEVSELIREDDEADEEFSLQCWGYSNINTMIWV